MAMDWEAKLFIVFSGTVAFSTVVYVVFTGLLMWETRKLRRVQTEPRVTVRVDDGRPGQFGYDLVVSNEGAGAAKNVTFKFEGDASYFRKSWAGKAPPPVDELPLIKDGTSHMSTNVEMRFHIGSPTPDEFERACKQPWVFKTRYEGFDGSEHSAEFTIDFTHFRGTFFDRDEMSDIARHLKDIERQLRKITQHLSTK